MSEGLSAEQVTELVQRLYGLEQHCQGLADKRRNLRSRQAQDEKLSFGGMSMAFSKSLAILVDMGVDVDAIIEAAK
jgi:ribosomal protein S2